MSKSTSTTTDRIYHKRIPRAKLFSNQQYQRPINQKIVAKIVSNFDPRKLGVISVAEREGRYYVFDGQHRLAALSIIHGNENFSVPCMVYKSESYEEEAKLFAQQYEGSHKLTRVEYFQAMLEAKDPEMRSVNRIVALCGLSVNKAKGRNYIACVDKIVSIHRDQGEDGLRAILTLIKETWDGDPDSLQVRIVGAVALFYKAYQGELDKAWFKKRLSVVSPTKIIRDGSVDAMSPASIRYAKVIYMLYTQNTRTHKLPYKFQH